MNNPPRRREPWSSGDPYPNDELYCAARHLAVAATQLTRDGQVGSPEVSRMATAEAQFRALASAFEGVTAARTRPLPPSPSVRLDADTCVPLAVLLAGGCDRRRGWVANRSIDADLVAGARELLCGLKWQLPGETETPFA